ncbi:HAD family hydrolase [Thermoleptolyngbya sichuanensis A183]|uniref:HAD family hydrolase n=1 Tax=Thermoleptolyngbya sichuanensis A183 TaxID=2737172 RepID=A0A6M8BJB6_9CYAN|nr:MULTISPECIES: HAD family hydrolase [Thermoleptolyngbya]QKD82515.1 HAD family hydrolase [Thermoleptolyngbya sichuanensis A183]
MVQKKLRIITDFDGPIMDVSERYYQVYQVCLEQVRRPGQTVKRLSKAEFWQLKRSQVPERQIGQMSGLDELQAQDFARMRRNTVHTPPYLSYDTPIPGAVETLERIQQAGIDLAVMTMRRTSELDEAFQRCNLGRFFGGDRRYCLSNDYVKTTDVQDKPLLMQRALSELPPAENWMIGDTEADVAAAKAHGIPVVSVLSGIRDRTQLSKHQPDWIVNNFAEALDVIVQHAGWESTVRKDIAWQNAGSSDTYSSAGNR